MYPLGSNLASLGTSQCPTYESGSAFQWWVTGAEASETARPISSHNKCIALAAVVDLKPIAAASRLSQI